MTRKQLRKIVAKIDRAVRNGWRPGLGRVGQWSRRRQA